MFNALIAAFSSFFSTTPATAANEADLDDVTHLLEAETIVLETPATEKPILHDAPSSFFRWVDELDDEVTEYISGQRVSQVLLRMETKSASVRARQAPNLAAAPRSAATPMYA